MASPRLCGVTGIPLQNARLHRGPLVEPWKRKAQWHKVGADTYPVFAYSYDSDRLKRQGSAMCPPTFDDHFLNHPDQPKHIGRYAAVIRNARCRNGLGPNRAGALVHQYHLDVSGPNIDAAGECAHGRDLRLLQVTNDTWSAVMQIPSSAPQTFPLKRTPPGSG